MKTLIVLFSYHNHNTEKLAKGMSEVLNAKIINPKDVRPQEILDYDLVGFGSGIYDGRHHESLQNLADRLSNVPGKKAFIFSTWGAPNGLVRKEYSMGSHTMLKDKLKAKGYEIVGEFGCSGFNINSFLKWFGGINKGRPNEKDLKNAKIFAENLINKNKK